MSVDYRRTPEHQYPAPLDDATAVYHWLLDSVGIEAGRIAVAGDSAGGGLAVTMTLRARTEGRPLPGALLLLSPWVDLAATGPSLATNRGTDVLFGGDTPMNIDGLLAMYLPPRVERTDPLISPMYADLAGLPPAYLQVGGAEMLLDDSRGFAERARHAGVDVRLDVFEGHQHTFQMMAGRAPVADEAVARLALWVRPHLGIS